MGNNDSYLRPRIQITENLDLLHIQEVNGYCPLCGKKLLVKKGKRVNKQYQIAHIYPNSPTMIQEEELFGLERLGDNCESFDNKIALCKNCHGYYDDHTTKEEYLKILELKKNLLEKSNARDHISSDELEEELIEIIEEIIMISDEELRKVELKYKGMKISKKLDDSNSLLRRKIERNVSLYYGFIKESFQNMEDEGKKKFNLIAAEFKTAFIKSSYESKDKQVIFDVLVEWVDSKVSSKSHEACEIMVSFFVQNCEVFDEITE